MTLKARPTTYRGVAMRSRLEARFAARLDDEGLEWTYEPRAYAGLGGQYLPDFTVAGDDNPVWFVEVRPTLERALLALTPMQVIWESEPDACLVVATPDGLWLAASAYRGRRWEVIATDGAF